MVPVNANSTRDHDTAGKRVDICSAAENGGNKKARRDGGDAATAAVSAAVAGNAIAGNAVAGNDTAAEKKKAFLVVAEEFQSKFSKAVSGDPTAVSDFFNFASLVHGYTEGRPPLNEIRKLARLYEGYFSDLIAIEEYDGAMWKYD